MVRGRPRDFDTDAKMLALLAQGQSVISVAKECKSHRNTVYRCIKRAERDGGPEIISDLSRLRAAQLEVQKQADLLREQDARIHREIKLAKYKNSATRLETLAAQIKSIMREIGIDGDLRDLQHLITTLHKEIRNETTEDNQRHRKHRRPEKDADRNDSAGKKRRT